MNDTELLELVADFSEGLLKKAGVSHAGNCLVMSEVLQWYLLLFDVKTDLINVEVDGVNHYCLQMENKKIIDATCSQFEDMPKVYTGVMPVNYKVKHNKEDIELIKFASELSLQTAFKIAKDEAQ